MRHGSRTGRVRGDAAGVPPAGAVLGDHQDGQSSPPHGACGQKPAARIAAAWACRNCRQAGPGRRGGGSMPAACRISPMVDGAAVTPSVARSPWIRRCPHRGFSCARRITRRAVPGTAGGRPGLRRPLVPYLLAASWRCQASSVAGVTGKISVPRLRGSSGASAANHIRSPARTGSGWRGGAAPRSRAGAPAAQHPSPSPYRTPRRPGRVAGEQAGRRS